MHRLAPLVAGVLFGMGLALSEMTNPAKVQNFLDVLGSWDPSLAFVMGGALMVTAITFPLVMRRSGPLYEERFSLPTRQDTDLRLVVGAGLFGVGWGLGGFCPGPALADLFLGIGDVYLFVAAMCAGVGLYHLVSTRRHTPSA
jgi:uncharacterized membrane protein YedE/YeeE